MINLLCILLFLGSTPEIFTEAGNELDLNFFQNDYKVKFERLELVDYNKDMVDVSVVTFKYNRTTAVANGSITFKFDFECDLYTIIQAYAFLSNEYRQFPLRFAANICKGFRANMGGIRNSLLCENLTEWPIARGKTYHVCNWFPDESKLPPFIPNGRYRLEIQFMFSSTSIFTVNVYAEVYRPIIFKY